MKTLDKLEKLLGEIESTDLLTGEFVSTAINALPLLIEVARTLESTQEWLAMRLPIDHELLSDIRVALKKLEVQ